MHSGRPADQDGCLTERERRAAQGPLGDHQGAQRPGRGPGCARPRRPAAGAAGAAGGDAAAAPGVGARRSTRVPNRSRRSTARIEITSSHSSTRKPRRSRVRVSSLIGGRSPLATPATDCRSERAAAADGDRAAVAAARPCVTRSPSTKVPFVEPRSTTRARPSTTAPRRAGERPRRRPAGCRRHRSGRARSRRGRAGWICRRAPAREAAAHRRRGSGMCGRRYAAGGYASGRVCRRVTRSGGRRVRLGALPGLSGSGWAGAGPGCAGIRLPAGRGIAGAPGWAASAPRPVAVRPFWPAAWSPSRAVLLRTRNTPVSRSSARSKRTATGPTKA